MFFLHGDACMLAKYTPCMYVYFPTLMVVRVNVVAIIIIMLPMEPYTVIPFRPVPPYAPLPYKASAIGSFSLPITPFHFLAPFLEGYSPAEGLHSLL